MESENLNNEDNPIKKEKEYFEQKDIIEKRKEKFIEFFKRKTIAIYLILLGIIIWISSFIRTRNLYGLRDITTGRWTLGPDLDPFLFLRWAKYIVAKGSLVIHDSMRYVPLGYDTSAELKLTPYAISWFHKVAPLFGGDGSVEFSAVIMPVFAFALTIIAFFFFVRELFKDSFINKHIPNIIAVISTFFLAVLPSLLPRTIAGIPEKESIGFLFMFLSFYLFLTAWKAKNMKRGLLYGLLAGVGTALMVHAWGGSIYVYLTIGISSLISFIFGKFNKIKFYSYGIWLFSSVLLTLPFTQRYTFKGLLMSTSTGLAFAVFLFLFVDFILFRAKKRLKIDFFDKLKNRIPEQFISAIVSVLIALILSSLFFGASFMPNFISDAVQRLKTPYTDRLSFTVAENRQPFFTGEWRGSFGPVVSGFPVFFWLFFIGSIYLFSEMIKSLRKKDRWILIGSYIFFLFAIIFSKYSPNSKLNGTTGISRTFYLGGLLIFAIVLVYVYYKNYKKREHHLFEKIGFPKLLLFSFFFISLVGARSAIRLVMVLGPPAAIIVSYFSVSLILKSVNLKTKKIQGRDGDEIIKMFVYVVTAIIILGTAYTLYTYTQGTYYQAKGFIPSSYTHQWQKAMKWVRENTPENSVFSHWWDYGYWLQSIGNRATMVDGGNAIPYWNHLVGRYVLTGTSEREALEFLYTHNVTHFLIDSTDIGKYSAFSNIGSDENYDRYSWIPTMIQDPRSIQETSNGTIYFYRGGFTLDGDLEYETGEGRKIYLPSGRAGLGGVLIKFENKINKNFSEQMITQPTGVFIYQGNQYRIPLRYAYYNGKKYDFGKENSIEAGVFIFPLASQQGQGVSINNVGALLYLSERTVNSQLARLYLFNEKMNGFKLMHTESNNIVESLRNRGSNIGEFLFFNGLQGPIKIWKMNYPKNIKSKPEYLATQYPKEELYVVKQ